MIYEKIYSCRCIQCKNPYRKWKLRMAHRNVRRKYKMRIKNGNEDVINTSIGYTD